jgi:hypothetical protein
MAAEKKNYLRFVGIALLLGIGLFASAISSHAADPTSTRLTFEILKDENKKPVTSAHIVVRFVNGKKFFIKDKQTSWEAQTNRSGQVTFPGFPTGHIKVQVIAKGFQTFGEEFDLSKPEETLTIYLKPPAGQVSAY